MDVAIKAQALSKTYRSSEKSPGLGGTLKHFFRRNTKRVHAVKGVDFEVARGDIVGFLGKNGAGKTTTLKMLSGLLRPSSGSAEVLGFTPYEKRRAFKKAITLVMGNKHQLIWDLPAADSLRIFAAVYDLDEQAAKKRALDLADMLDVREKMQTPVRKLSLGERMKLELVAALLHRPKVLFLDEPTLGLDVNAQASIRQFLKSYIKDEGATALLTSHYMADIEALCQRVVVIQDGDIFFDGDLAGLSARVDARRDVRLTLAAPLTAPYDGRWGTPVHHHGVELQFRLSAEEMRRALPEMLGAFDVRDVTVSAPPIEEIMGRVFTASPEDGVDAQ